LKLPDTLIQLAFLPKSDPQPVMSFRVISLPAERFPEFSYSRIAFSLALEGNAQVKMSRRVAWFEPNCFFKLSHRLSPSVRHIQRHPKLTVRLNKIRLDTHGLLKVPNCAHKVSIVYKLEVSDVKLSHCILFRNSPPKNEQNSAAPPITHLPPGKKPTPA